MCYSVKRHHSQHAITRTLKTRTFWQTPWGLSEGAKGWWWSCPWSDTAPECETATGLWVSLVYTCYNNYPLSDIAPECETARDLWVSMVNICNNNNYSQTQQQNVRQQQVSESRWWTSVIITITHSHTQHQNMRQQQVFESRWWTSVIITITHSTRTWDSSRLASLAGCAYVIQLWSDSSKMQDKQQNAREQRPFYFTYLQQNVKQQKSLFITRHSSKMQDNISPNIATKCETTCLSPDIPQNARQHVYHHSNKMQDSMSFIIRYRNKMWDNTSFIIKMKDWEQKASINQSVICFMSVHSKVID